MSDTADRNDEARGGGAAARGVAAREAAFETVESERGPASPSNLDLLMDVTVPVTVSVGSVRKTIAEIVDLGPGSVIDLERPTGEPVDVLVNGKLIARGEVMVVGERYGIRITELVK